MDVCDYYVEVGVRDRLTPTARYSTAARAAQAAPHGGMKALAHRGLLTAAFEPSVLRRLPEEDVPGNRFAPEVAMFAFPHGIRLVTSEEAAINAIPVVTSFVLTDTDKNRMYGACIVWYEQLSAEVVTAYLDDGDSSAADSTAPEVHAPEAICLLSRVAIFDALMQCCRQRILMQIRTQGCRRLGVAHAHSLIVAVRAASWTVFRMRISAAANQPLQLSAVAQLLAATMPAPGMRLEVQLGNVTVQVVTPRANELPQTMASRDFLLLFQVVMAVPQTRTAAVFSHTPPATPAAYTQPRAYK